MSDPNVRLNNNSGVPINFKYNIMDDPKKVVMGSEGLDLYSQPTGPFGQKTDPSGPPTPLLPAPRVDRTNKPPSDEVCARCNPDRCGDPDKLPPDQRRIIGEGTNKRRDIIVPNMGGKKRKRKTLRKGKKSKSMRKHRKTNKKHAKRRKSRKSRKSRK